MNCIKMRFFMVFCACFAFATMNANAAPTVRTLGRTTPASLPGQNAKKYTADGQQTTIRSATNKPRTTGINRIKPSTSPARITTITLPKTINVENKPNVNVNNNTVPSDVPQPGEFPNIEIYGQYGVTVERDGDTYTTHLTGIDGTEDPADIYVYQNGEFRKFEYNITPPNDFSGNVNVCNDWESELPCHDTIDVNMIPNNNG